jgi:hypothetical protein
MWGVAARKYQRIERAYHNLLRSISWFASTKSDRYGIEGYLKAFICSALARYPHVLYACSPLHCFLNSND